MRQTRCLLVSAIGLLVVSGLVSCRHSEPSSPASSSRDDRRAGAVPQGLTTRPMGEHWVQDERLRGLMRALHSWAAMPSTRAMPEEPESPTTQDLNKAFAEAASAADSL